ncbi:hypothetical protein C1645_762635 [Glomus cerebriforme]|uniref:Uncharacterized protein n=1 Tax=Glomus cerebriforme TaxID=658196 RepID=A0A397T7I6_9GLOM|nr:hypothetical protein C1645_762635 [Glomus cerebriforme]
MFIIHILKKFTQNFIMYNFFLASSNLAHLSLLVLQNKISKDPVPHQKRQSHNSMITINNLYGSLQGCVVIFIIFTTWT